MDFEALIAQLPTSDPCRRSMWFDTLLQRVPDAVPMQVAQDDDALTLVVSNLRANRTQLALAGLEPGDIEPGDFASTLQIRDPDGNLVVLTQPGRA